MIFKFDIHTLQDKTKHITIVKQLQISINHIEIKIIIENHYASKITQRIKKTNYR